MLVQCSPHYAECLLNAAPSKTFTFFNLNLMEALNIILFLLKERNDQELYGMISKFREQDIFCESLLS